MYSVGIGFKRYLYIIIYDERHIVSAAKLFDRYFTVNEGQASTGLGFSIAKELITRNGGTIEADLKDGILMIIVNFKMKEAEEQA